jgi:rRNA maturation protein Nop10
MVVPHGGGVVYVPHPYEYGGADELIAFRILRASEDGSITILWKRLQKFSPPRIKQ